MSIKINVRGLGSESKGERSTWPNLIIRGDVKRKDVENCQIEKC